ncbi:hypothetical protein TKK_0000343 [Trichogramma kaykai]|uniref:Retrotransposon gag domain-containing protein n=1 Tax=Trichogramma kaykai TaxID=54128 RepID=A0ABD2W7V1_9HYME
MASCQDDEIKKELSAEMKEQEPNCLDTCVNSLEHQMYNQLIEEKNAESLIPSSFSEKSLVRELENLKKQLQEQQEKLDRYKRVETLNQHESLIDLQVSSQQQSPQNAYYFSSDFTSMISNAQSMQLDIKIQEFEDENSMNPLEFLDDVDRFYRIKNIKDDKKLNVMSVLLQGKARIWFELYSPFQSFDQFRKAFINEFYSVSIQVKVKNKWVSKRYDERLKNLQTFFYRQLKEANYLRPKMSDFEKNFTIVQQFSADVRKTLTTINFNDTNAIVLTLSNLDAIDSKNDFECKKVYTNEISVTKSNTKSNSQLNREPNDEWSRRHSWINTCHYGQNNTDDGHGGNHNCEARLINYAVDKLTSIQPIYHYSMPNLMHRNKGTINDCQLQNMYISSLHEK